MKLLATLRAEDVELKTPHFDYTSFKPRAAARAIIFDGERVALIRVKEHGYYMLPGGGIEHEDMLTGLYREITEELGCKIEVTGEVGAIEVYFDRWSKRQTDSCYTAKKKVGLATSATPTDFEQEEGHSVVWTKSLRDAIQFVETAAPVNRDGKLVRARDLLFLKQVAANHDI